MKEELTIKRKVLWIIILFIIQSILSLCFLNTSIWYGTGNLVIKIPIMIIILINVLNLGYILAIKQLLTFVNKELELKNLTIKLKESNEIITFLKVHKHDFFNHLQIIRGLSQMEETQRVIDYVDSIVKKVGSSYDIATLSIPEIAVVIMQKLGEASRDNIKTDIAIRSTLENLKGNAMDYSQILFNLLDNAIYALLNCEMQDKALYVEIDEDELYYHIAITNNYPVIPKEVQSRIFDRGYTTKKNSEGGMGLYIVKGLVDKCKGKIVLESEPDFGTTFAVSFPKDGGCW